MPYIDPNGSWLQTPPGAQPSPMNGPTPGAGRAGPFDAAAAGFSILGGLLKGMSAIQAGDYNATVDNNNAKLADVAAGDAIARGHLAAATALMRGAQLQGKQTTALAASGVQANTGSALDVLTNTGLMSKLDADKITNDAAREAWGYRTKGSQYRQQAALDEAQGHNAAGASILGGITGAATYGTKSMLAIS